MTIVYECDICNKQFDHPTPAVFQYSWAELKQADGKVIQVLDADTQNTNPNTRQVDDTVNICFDDARALIKKMKRKKGKLLTETTTPV